MGVKRRVRIVDEAARGASDEARNLRCCGECSTQMPKLEMQPWAPGARASPPLSPAESRSSGSLPWLIEAKQPRVIQVPQPTLMHKVLPLSTAVGQGRALET
jgi:hypothetical protein